MQLTTSAILGAEPITLMKFVKPVAMTLLWLIIVGCSKKDPAPIICYLTTNVFGSITDTYTYNDKNQVISITESGTPTLIITYTYDANGDLKIGSFSDGTTYVYTFDGNHQLIKREYLAGDNVATFAYNSTGQHISTVYEGPGCSGTCTTTWTYAYPNTTTHNASLVTVNNGVSTETYAYQYDSKFNPFKPVLYSSTGSDNNVTQLIFSNNGSPITTSYTYEYNERGYPTKKTGSDSSVETFTYVCK